MITMLHKNNSISLTKYDGKGKVAEDFHKPSIYKNRYIFLYLQFQTVEVC